MTDCIGVRGTCRQCGSPVLSYLCNNDLIAVRPEAGDHDYWACCSNVLCSNHQGEGYIQFDPDWVDSPRAAVAAAAAATVPDELTDEELLKAWDAPQYEPLSNNDVLMGLRDVIAADRARWGRPMPLPSGEVERG